MDNFGIILACYQRDYIFAKGCCASIRYFLGDVPICLIVDGDFSTQELHAVYGVQTIYRSEVSHAVLRDKKYASSTKMIAFWESPWEHFLYLDADIIAWGDILKFVDFDNSDIVIDKPRYSYSEEEINRWFFKGKQLEKIFPDFQWKNHPYFCTGIFFAKRDMFSLDDYENLIELKLQNPGMFYGMDQGLLNFMIFRSLEQGKLRLNSEILQIIVPDFSPEYLEENYPVDEHEPILNGQSPIAIHWSGKKPFVSRSEVYPTPMNFFRLKYLQDRGQKNKLLSNLYLQLEDFGVYKHKLSRRALTGRSTSMLKK